MLNVRGDHRAAFRSNRNAVCFWEVSMLMYMYTMKRGFPINRH